MDPEADAEADTYHEHDVGRTLTFSDGVFAIAITLLVLDLPVPELAPGTAATHLLGAVAHLAPRFVAFVFSFLLVGFYWNLHRRLFRKTRRTSQWLIWLNLLMLMTICLLPFSTGLVSRYGNTLTGMELYASNLILVSAVMGTIRLYTERAGLVEPRGGRPASIVDCYTATAAFALGMVLAPISVYVGYAAWAVAAPLFSLLRRLARRLGWRG